MSSVAPAHVQACAAAWDYLRLSQTAPSPAMGVRACFFLVTMVRMRGALCTFEHYASLFEEAFGVKCPPSSMNTGARRVNHQLAAIGSPLRVENEYAQGYWLKAPPGFEWPDWPRNFNPACPARPKVAG